jgi:hypothetical protein
MDLPLEAFRFREIQELLYSQLHEANESLRLAKIRELPQTEQDRASDAARIALNRWQALVIRREIPEDLKEWDGTGKPPGSRVAGSGA